MSRRSVNIEHATLQYIIESLKNVMINIKSSILAGISTRITEHVVGTTPLVIYFTEELPIEYLTYEWERGIRVYSIHRRTLRKIWWRSHIHFHLDFRLLCFPYPVLGLSEIISNNIHRVIIENNAEIIPKHKHYKIVEFLSKIQECMKSINIKEVEEYAKYVEESIRHNGAPKTIYFHIVKENISKDYILVPSTATANVEKNKYKYIRTRNGKIEYMLLYTDDLQRGYSDIISYVNKVVEKRIKTILSMTLALIFYFA